jgi:hypothetical protein
MKIIHATSGKGCCKHRNASSCSLKVVGLVDPKLERLERNFLIAGKPEKVRQSQVSAIISSQNASGTKNDESSLNVASDNRRGRGVFGIARLQCIRPVDCVGSTP